MTDRDADIDAIVKPFRRQRLGACSCNDPYCPRCTSDTGTEAFGEGESGLRLTVEDVEFLLHDIDVAEWDGSDSPEKIEVRSSIRAKLRAALGQREEGA